MAAMAAQAALAGSVASASLREYQGLRAGNRIAHAAALPTLKSRGRKSLGVRCSFLGSPTNLIMVASTTLCMIAGRFGLAPSANREATAGLKLIDRDSGLKTNDPAGFTVVDVLAFGSFGHIVGVGIVMGLKGIGAIPLSTLP